VTCYQKDKWAKRGNENIQSELFQVSGSTGQKSCFSFTLFRSLQNFLLLLKIVVFRIFVSFLKFRITEAYHIFQPEWLVVALTRWNFQDNIVFAVVTLVNFNRMGGVLRRRIRRQNAGVSFPGEVVVPFLFTSGLISIRAVHCQVAIWPKLPAD
jgi:hypothetical protein